MCNGPIWLKNSSENVHISFQLVNFVFFLKSKMTIFQSLLTILFVIYSLVLKIVKFHLSLIAKISKFQLVNFHYFYSKMSI